MSTSVDVKLTPLYERHISLGAKMVDFAGYKMPLQYTGIIDEHNTVRNKAGIFDLSHMGEIEIRGESSVDFVNYIVTNDVAKLSEGQILYTVMCNENGGILDDVLVYRMSGKVMMVVNAANREKVYRWLLNYESKFPNVRVLDMSDSTALIAVQGPKSEEILQRITPVDLSSIEYYHFVMGKILDCDGIISRTGYTGEDGFEIYVKNEYAEGIWDALMVEGEAFGLKPIGLGARDTLRLEAKYALYGNELSEDVNPLEVGLKWVVKFDKEDFIGKTTLLKVKEEKPSRKLIGFVMKKGIARHGYKVFKGDEEIGFVTSGTHSPTLQKAIGLALIKRGSAKVGDEIEILVRKKKIGATVVKTPFYVGSVKRKK